jgi:putative heme iron utilization protein
MGPHDGSVQGVQRSPAEEARTLVAQCATAALATLGEDGAPWSSLVALAATADGTPVLCLSTLAEHGRNAARDARASLMVAAGPALDRGRVTLAGRLEAPTAPEIEAARSPYDGFPDFTYYALRVERVRWVGGPGRMAWVAPADYHAAQPDPVAPSAAGAVAHLNADHAHNLLDMARALGGHPDARAAACTGIDRYGLDLRVETPKGAEPVRIAFAERVDAPDGLRAAAVELARRARGATVES